MKLAERIKNIKWKGKIVPLILVALIAYMWFRPPAWVQDLDETPPPFSFTTLDGREGTLDSLRGKVVLVNFWATWCPPCRQELPDLVDIQSEFGGERFTVLGVSLDQTGPSTVRRFAQEMNLNFPLLMGNQEVVTQYGNFRGIPTSFLLNQRHEQVKRYMGMVTKNQLSGDLNSLFDEAV